MEDYGLGYIFFPGGFLPPCLSFFFIILINFHHHFPFFLEGGRWDSERKDFLFFFIPISSQFSVFPLLPLLGHLRWGHTLASEQPGSADTRAESLQLSPVHVSSFLADCIRAAVRARTEGGRFSRISSLRKHGCKSTVTLRIGGSGTRNIFIIFFFSMAQQEADEKLCNWKKNISLTQYI